MSSKTSFRPNNGQDSNSRHILKFISLLSAITLWFYVLNSEPLQIEKRIPLTFITPTDLAVNVDVPETVRVKIKGSRAFVQDLDLEKEKLIVDLRDYPYNQETFAVTFEKGMVRLPFGVEVLDIVPKQVVLSLEREIRKVVPVRLRTVGEVGKDLKLIQKNFGPKEFMIRGPYNVLKKTPILNTMPMDLSTLEGQGEIKLPIEIPDSRIVIENLEEVQVEYVIRPNKANLSLMNIPIKFLSKHTKIKANIQEAAVDVLISEDRKKSFNAEDLSIIAEIPDSIKERGKVKLSAKLPDGVNLLQIRPEFINVEILNN